MRDVGVLYVSLIGSIKEYERVILQGVVYPLAHLVLSNHRARRVVGIAQVDDLNRATCRYLGHKTVLSRYGHISHVRPLAVAMRASPAYHHVGVDIDGIDGVGNTNIVVPVEQFLEVARIRLSTIVDEHLVDIQPHTTRQEVVLHYRLTQEVVALLGTISAEGLSMCHLIHRLVHSLCNGRTQRLGNIANAKRYYVSLGMGNLECLHPLGYVGKEIVLLQVKEMCIY